MQSQTQNVQVAIRVRPLTSNYQQGIGGFLVQDDGIKRCVQSVTEDRRTIALDKSSGGETFTFDYIADEETEQSEIFEHVGKPIVEACLQGYNGSVFAYGQTGSGKTFTIQG